MLSARPGLSLETKLRNLMRTRIHGLLIDPGSVFQLLLLTSQTSTLSLISR
jgi:hypothetical protein